MPSGKAGEPLGGMAEDLTRMGALPIDGREFRVFAVRRSMREQNESDSVVFGKKVGLWNSMKNCRS